MSTVTLSVMDRLRTETAGHHAQAEGKGLQREMVTGRITPERYGAWLGQMLLVHRALESAIATKRAGFEPLRVVTDEQTHSRRIAEDLAFYGIDAAAARPVAGAARLIEQIAAADGPTLLGMHYVLEGSMNGNKYIAMALRKGMGLTPGGGDRYLDPYGEQQRATWAAWKAAVNAHDIAAADSDAAVAGAKMMFDGVAAISDGV